MNKLAYWRGMRALTVRDLSKSSGVNASTISQIEKGHRKAYLSTLGKLANALHVDISEFVELVETESPKINPRHLEFAGV